MGKENKVTVIVLYQDECSEHYVGVLSEEPSRERQEEIAKKYGATIDGDEGAFDEDTKTVSFRQCGLDTMELVNIWGA